MASADYARGVVDEDLTDPGSFRHKAALYHQGLTPPFNQSAASASGASRKCRFPDGMHRTMKGMATTSSFPETVDAAVRLLRALVPEQEQIRIASLTRPELNDLHFGLGMWIRNNLGLWKDNHALVQACGAHDPDDASAVLIEAFWQHLQDLAPRLH